MTKYFIVYQNNYDFLKLFSPWVKVDMLDSKVVAATTR